MIVRFVLSSVMLFAPVAYAQHSVVPQTPQRELPPNDFNAPKTGLQQAPPGKLCLVEAPERCGDKAELIRKPYTGEGELYYLERSAKEPEQKPPAAPSLKPLPN